MAGRSRKIQVGAEPPENRTLPPEARILPVRNTVLYPFGILPLGVSRDRDTRLLNEAIASDRLVVVAMQRDPSVEDPGPADLHDVGTACNLLRMVRQPDGQLSVLL
ncbi:MAG: LON peptidase substrate-binding domain-containing protein, partial [Candidatus Eisenbacteria bacterium]|nr:LON peptidase substrate-binding domain-containing protein [Candidatus Eisenbacteria bacterium]